MTARTSHPCERPHPERDAALTFILFSGMVLLLAILAARPAR